jgi:hypothetical protein
MTHRNTGTPCACGQPRRSFDQADCLDCHARSMRNHRATTPLTERQRIVLNARAYTGVYRRRGKLVPQPCEVCGNTHVVSHHDDYSFPLVVRWFCRWHHRAWHREHGPGRISHRPDLNAP